MTPARGAVVASAGADLVPATSPGAASSPDVVSATRSGAQLLVAAAISLVANYLFLLGSGRLLGAADYGTLAALTGLLTVVLLPTGALQMAASREISRREAIGERDAAAAFSRGLLVLGLKLAVPLLLVALALLVPLRELLRIDATAPVALALSVLGGVFVYPTVLGIMQGQQRFRALAFNSAAPMVLRLVLLVVLAVAGMRLYGALGAITVSAVFAVALGLVTIRGTLRSARGVAVPSLRPFLRYLVPVAVGLFGIAVLTNADIIVVKARFSAEDAGVYAAASAFARVAFFLPSTILAVVFPRTAARQARGEQSADILGRSVIVTIGFCAALVGGYLLIGSDLISLTYGAEFESAAELLVPFCLAMTCFSVLNVLLGYHLSRNESRFAWIVAGSVVVQLGLLATVPNTLREMLWVDLAVGVALLVAHELTMGSSAGALAAGYRRFGVGATVHRAAAWVVSARGALLEAVVVLGGFWLLAVAVTWPLVLGLGDTMPGPFPNDGTGTVAWFWQLHHEGGYGLLGTTHHTLTGAPLGWDQGSALNFQWLLPYYPTYLLAGVVGEVAAVNLAALAGLAFSGAAMYLLVRYLGCGRLVATWAGVVYLTFPWLLERVMAGHASLTHLEVFPLLVLACIAWVRRPTDGRAALVALVVTAAWLTSGYFGAMSLIALVGVTCVAVLVNRRSLGWAHAVGRAAKLWAMAIVAGAGLLMVSVLAGGAAGVALGRDASEVEFYGAHLRDYLPDPANPILGGITDAAGGSSIPYYPGVENMLYPGVLTLALALLWVGVAVFRRSAAPRAHAGGDTRARCRDGRGGHRRGTGPDARWRSDDPPHAVVHPRARAAVVPRAVSADRARDGRAHRSGGTRSRVPDLNAPAASRAVAPYRRRRRRNVRRRVRGEHRGAGARSSRVVQSCSPTDALRRGEAHHTGHRGRVSADRYGNGAELRVLLLATGPRTAAAERRELVYRCRRCQAHARRPCIAGHRIVAGATRRHLDRDATVDFGLG